MAEGEFEVIPKDWEGRVISFRHNDQYVCATEMCKACDKLWGHYWSNKQTKDFAEALASNIGIPILELVESRVGGTHSGTWVHPQIAINLAQWLSPAFAVKVTGWIFELMSKGSVSLKPNPPKVVPSNNGVYSNRLKYQLAPMRGAIIRKFGRGWWAVLGEASDDLSVLEGLLELHNLPILKYDSLDGSIGKCWSNYRVDNGGRARSDRYVLVTLNDGREKTIEARVYPESELLEFRHWKEDLYLPAGLGRYLINKYKDTHGALPPASVADAASMRLAGRQALLPTPIRAGLRNAGGMVAYTVPQVEHKQKSLF